MGKRTLVYSLILSTLGLLNLSAHKTTESSDSDSRSKNIEITWMGHAMFMIQDSKGTKIITDPYSAKTGYRPPEVSADIVTVSHRHYDHDNINVVGGNPQIVESPGKVDVKGITIEGIPSYHDEVKGQERGRNTIFKFYINGLTVVHMGDFGQPITGDQVDALKGSDILLIPIGGTYTIDANQATEIIKYVGPKIAIPMHYKTEDTVINIAPIDPFISQVQNVREKQSHATVSKSSLPDETEVWIMEYVQ